MSDETTTETWPPPATKERPWHEQWLRSADYEFKAQFVVREVRLWGRTVLIDEDLAVYCPDCREFVDVAELASPHNGHPSVGLPLRPGVRIPMSRDDQSVAPRRPRDPAEVEW